MAGNTAAPVLCRVVTNDPPATLLLEQHDPKYGLVSCPER